MLQFTKLKGFSQNNVSMTLNRHLMLNKLRNIKIRNKIFILLNLANC